jgi:hypothetical protein
METKKNESKAAELLIRPHGDSWVYLEWRYPGADSFHCLNTDNAQHAIGVTTMILNRASSDSVEEFVSSLYGKPTEGAWL